VVIIDCMVLLPLLFFGGLRLWPRDARSYVLGGLLLSKAPSSAFDDSLTTTRPKQAETPSNSETPESA